eukprot:Skav219898  [mRNA]  locus=scaffold841:204068:204922:+ [translate_table: standard]
MDGLRPLTPEEIKAKWEQNREESALAGSWMHLQCECVLNGGCIEGACKEMNLFGRFLGSVPPLLAYRTEWCAWASQERVAGTIDFAARAADGSLVFLFLGWLRIAHFLTIPGKVFCFNDRGDAFACLLSGSPRCLYSRLCLTLPTVIFLRLFDWKRAKNLPAKFTNVYRALSPPLMRLPDATGVKYCLQLNLYRYMLQKYYGQLVSAMFIVCLHPELAAPWVYPVPMLEAEVEEVMALQRQGQRQQPLQCWRASFHAGFLFCQNDSRQAERTGGRPSSPRNLFG